LVFHLAAFLAGGAVGEDLLDHGDLHGGVPRLFAVAHIDGVEAAFLHGGFLPPPAALPLVLAGAHGAGAGLAADADETPAVEGVVGHLVGADVVPYLAGGPVGGAVVLGEARALAGKGAVLLDHRDGGAGAGALVAALAGDPGVQGQQLGAQGADLADAAAFLVIVPVEAEQALFPHQGLNLGGV